MEKILISACLLGEPVRYDGRGKRVSDARLAQWEAEGRLVVICPEILGGLPVPRPPAELQGGDGHQLLSGKARVITQRGVDLSEQFIQGAEAALALARRFACRIAILKADSPSCGNQRVYDGSFNGRLIVGSGVTAARLRQAGIRVFNEGEISAVQAWLEQQAQA